MFLSFVIPLYNAGQFVTIALDSIFSISLEESEYEVIVVDDGSTDDGAEVVKKYAEKHRNLKLMQQQNQGASAARNRGIEAAQGEFIWFVDADDRIQPDIIDEVWRIYQERPDTELFGFNHVDWCGDKENPRVTYRQRLSTDGLGLLRSHPYMYLWNRIFRKSAIGDIRFPEGTCNTEDWYFDLMVFARLRHVECIPMSGYYYNSANPYSTLRNRSRESLKKNADDSQLMHRLIWEEVQKTEDPGIKAELQRSLNYSVMGFFYGMFVDHFSVREYQTVMKKYGEMGLYPIPKSGSKRGNKFLRLANRPYLLYPVVLVRNMFSPILSFLKSKQQIGN